MFIAFWYIWVPFGVMEWLRVNPFAVKFIKKRAAQWYITLGDDFLFKLTHREVWAAWSKSIWVWVCVCVCDGALLTQSSYTTHSTSHHCIPKVQFSAWLDEDEMGHAETGDWTRCIRGFDASPRHTRGNKRHTMPLPSVVKVLINANDGWHSQNIYREEQSLKKLQSGNII